MLSYPRHVLGRLRLMAASRLPDTPVERRIRGVRMTLPRRHGLPYFARKGTKYADNLVRLAELLGAHEGSVNLLDVGANVGDSTMLVLAKVDGCAVCLEANPRWLPYLEANLAQRPGVEIVPAVLVAPGTDTSVPLGVRSADVGSSIVVRDEDETAGTAEAESFPALTTTVLLEQHPQLRDVRLIKSDTDGYDVMLVNAYLETFVGSRPVIFFEFDPRPTRMVTPEYEPQKLWAQLVDAGYTSAVVWDNLGNLLFSAATEELAERSAVLDLTVQERGYGFWDVAVAHVDDPVGGRVLEEIVAD
ncbi:FkbM family methyltransferase [Nocardioides sp. J9]|uniref:FkbM family methyltransferase n=1 Tax=Nocardioides sp. J9 TaxID=935844 RepID=UPI0011A4D9A2|nr:FkbM family methyltransferase [Nocardioides sp. J9]TWG93901.1 FkbM family methyltransferase [Nocardioides sp. J9]